MEAVCRLAMPLSPANPSASGPPDWAARGKVPQLDRFLLGPELGRGAMGRVVRAWDPMLRRVVALKLLLQDDPMEMARFLREGQLQALIDHPNICRVYEVGISPTQPYIAMQLIEGFTLDHYHGRLSSEESARIMADVASALHAAHRRGLIHRDIKPGNIALEPPSDGRHRAHIMDFGLARVMSDPAEFGFFSEDAGTPAFMSPEQARGEAIGPASDLYSLGATFHAVICGQPPRAPVTDDAASRKQALAFLRHKQPELDSDLVAIILKCLHPEPQRRYSSAAALEQDLRAWLAGKAVNARPLGLLSGIERSFRRRKGHWIAGGVLVGGLVGLVLWHGRSMSRQRKTLSLAIQFIAEAEVEASLLARERMLPPHDIRPAMERALTRITQIEREMARIGAPALGPGHHAIGRLYADLGNLDLAESNLQLAWEKGPKTPDLASSLGAVKAQRLYESLDRGIERGAYRIRPLAGEGLARLKEIEALLEQAPREGASSRRIALAEAYLALCKGEPAAAAARCRQAFTEAPWLHEALVLEALALQQMDDAQDPAERNLRRDQWMARLNQAHRLAPSDDRVHAAQIRRLAHLGRLALGRFGSEESWIKQAREIHEQAQLIHPDSLPVLAAVLELNLVSLEARIERGEDVQADLQVLLERHRARLDRDATTQVLEWDVLGLAELYAEEQYAHGQDPRPWLEWAGGRLKAKDSVAWLYNRLFLARVLEDWSLDPTGTWKSMREAMAKMPASESKSLDVKLIQALILVQQGRWEREQGVDEREHLRESVKLLTEIQEHSPDDPWVRHLLIRMKAQLAVAMGLYGEPVEATLREARALVPPGNATSFEHHQSLASLCLADALCNGGLSGKPPLEKVMEGRRHAARAVAMNPGDVEVRILSAELALLEARARLGIGQPTRTALAQADSLAVQGLEKKGDSAALQLIRVRVEAFRALESWCDSLPTKEDAFQLAVQARRLGPGRPEAQWLHGLLAHHRTREVTGLADMDEAMRRAPKAIRRLLVSLPELPPCIAAKE